MIRDQTSSATSGKLIWPLRLTWAGLWCERLTRAFWPLWTIVIGALSVLAFGIQDHLPIEAVWIGGVATLGGSLWAITLLLCDCKARLPCLAHLASLAADMA